MLQQSDLELEMDRSQRKESRDAPSACSAVKLALK